MLVTWVAVDALPVSGPINDVAVMLPVLVRFCVLGLKLRPVECVFSVVAVPPVVVLLNRTRCAAVDEVLETVTPEPVPAGPRGTTRDSTGATGFVESIVAEHVG